MFIASISKSSIHYSFPSLLQLSSTSYMPYNIIVMVTSFLYAGVCMYIYICMYVCTHTQMQRQTGEERKKARRVHAYSQLYR